MTDASPPEPPPTDDERATTLRDLEAWLETPMTVLGFVWLALLVVELRWGLNRALEYAATAVWALFVLDFGLRLALAPGRWRYLRRNWLTAISLVLPALRVVRVARVVRLLRVGGAARGLRLVKVIGSLNRGMRALRATMARRGAGYVAVLTGLVTVVGAAGMQAFEGQHADGGGFRDFATALWWTAMVMTTMGSEHWPRTAEGRVLCLVLATYAFAVFGYVTATLATFFVGRDAARTADDPSNARALEAIREELTALRREVERLRRGDQSP